MRYWIVTAFGIMAAGSAMAADSALVKRIDSGNVKYAAGEFDEALEAYKLAEADCPECPELAYNQGLAYYRLRDFEHAHEKFNEALLTQDLKLEQRAKYNLGNVAYSQALEKMSSPKEAIEHAQRAIAFYRDALQLDETDTDVRTNIEIAQLLIKQLLDQQKQEQENQEQNKDQEQQSEQNEHRDDSQQSQDNEQQQQEQQEEQEQQEQQEGSQDEQSEEQQEQQQQEGQGEQEQEQQEQQQQQQQSGEAEPGDQQQAEAQQYEQRELTREEAERLLQAVRDKEAQRRDEKAREMRAKRVPVKRDW